MTSKEGFKFVSGQFSKSKVEGGTRWILAAAIFIAVFLTVAKSTVRELKDLEREIHQPVDPIPLQPIRATGNWGCPVFPDAGTRAMYQPYPLELIPGPEKPAARQMPSP
jgi:hypothetical protein